MSMVWCHGCDKNIDTDFNSEHFIPDTEECAENHICTDKCLVVDVADYGDDGDGTGYHTVDMLTCSVTGKVWAENED